MILSLRHPVERRAGRPLPLMQARPGEPTLGLASRAFRQGCGRIGAAPAAQDTGLKTGVGWASPRTGRGPLGQLGPSPPICLPCSSRRIGTHLLLKLVAPSPVDGRVGLTCVLSPRSPGSHPPPPGDWPSGSSSLTLKSPEPSAPRLPSPMNLGNWTFRENCHGGSELGVAWSSCVPGKFWTLMWALTACLQR